MPLSKAKYLANKRYNDKTYERIQVVLRKGEREVIKEFATQRGMSLNAFVKEAIAEKMEREKDVGKR